MTKAFALVDFVEYDPDTHTSIDLDSATKFYTGECLILDFVWKVEEPDVSFETEKLKASNLRNIAVLIKTGLVPPEYV